MNDHSPEEDFDLKRKQAEIRKLEAETKALNQSHFAKPANWIPLLAAAAAIITALAQYQTSDLRIKEATLKSQQDALVAEREMLSLKQQIADINAKLLTANSELLQATEEKDKAKAQKDALGKQIVEQEERRKRQQELLTKLEEQIVKKREALAHLTQPHAIQEIDQQIAQTVSELKAQESDCVFRIDFTGNWVPMKRTGATWIPCEDPTISTIGTPTK